MVAGMFLAGVAFIMAAILQIQIEVRQNKRVMKHMLQKKQLN
jgi:hypothetical protein